MKNILLAIALLAVTGGTVSAQSSASKAGATGLTAAENERLLFVSKVSELESSTNRNNMPAANAAMTSLFQMMTTRINYTNGLAAKAADNASKQDLTQRAQTQQSLAAEIKVLSVDLQKNRAELSTKLRDFLKAY